jgi:hypothetical protein
MKLIRFLVWTFFAALLGYNVYQWVELNKVECLPFSMLELEYAHEAQGLSLLSIWSNTHTNHGTTLLQEGLVNIRWDFVFVVSFVSLLIILSYNQMQREARHRFNEFLRFNFPLAILIGLLSIVENMVLLQDMKSYNVGYIYHSSYWVTLPKFILSGWAVGVWIISKTTANNVPTPR